MTTFEHPIALLSEQYHAFAEKVAWHTVGIVNLVPEQRTSQDGRTISIEPLGTGTACRWKGRRLILTAEHVLEGASPCDVRFHIRPSGQIEWNTRGAQSVFAERTQLGIERIIRSKSEDLACLILDPKCSGHPRLQFCDFPDDIGAVPPSGSGVFLIGYPVDQSFSVASAQQSNGPAHYIFAAVPAACWRPIVGEVPSSLSSSYDPDRHFLIRFDPAEEGSMPHGYSGTGVWYQNSATREVWAAVPVLAGVQMSWYSKSKLMQAIRPEVVRQFLEQTLG